MTPQFVHLQDVKICCWLGKRVGLIAFFDAMNGMTEFYSIKILRCPEQTAMEWTVDALFSKGLNI